MNDELVENKKEHKWMPGLWATFYVILVIISSVYDQFFVGDSEDPILLWIGMMILPFIGYSLYRAQVAINWVADDVKGSSNSALTGLNWLWIVLGAIWWGIIVLATFMPDL